MSTTDQENWDVMAGEYVLGTIEGTERKMLRRIAEHDVDFQRRKIWWRERFSELDTHIEQISPPRNVWPSISNELGFNMTDSGSSFPDSLKNDLADMSNTAGTVLEEFSLDDIDDPENGTLPTEIPTTEESTDPNTGQWGDNQEGHPRSSDRRTRKRRKSPRSSGPWRSLAALATIGCVVLGGMLWQQTSKNEAEPEAATFDYEAISLLGPESLETYWVIDVAPRSRTLRITAIAPPELEVESLYHLWQIRTASTTFVSLGVLTLKRGQSLVFPAPTTLALDDTRFAVSIEPATGSGVVPTGDVLYEGELLQLDTRSPPW